MKFYLASIYSRRNEMQRHAATLTTLDHEITSRWITGAHDVQHSYTDEAPRFAQQDLDDIDHADAFILFNGTYGINQGKGGKHVEFGYAYANNKMIFCLEHRSNPFCFLPRVHYFLTFSDFLNDLCNHTAPN